MACTRRYGTIKNQQICSMKKLALITVVHKNYDILEDYFESLGKQTDQDFALYIVDNSGDSKKIELPQYAKVISTENKGYAAAVNVGIAKAIEEGYDKFLITNSDIIFDRKCVRHTKQALENHPNTIIGGKIYYAKGFEFHKDRYSEYELGRVLWYAGGRISWEHALTPHRGVDLVDSGQFNTEGKTGFINGCFMAYDKKVYETVGIWDESYFMYFEDSDFCVRALKKGIELWYDPQIVIWHKNSQSTGGSGSAFHEKYMKKNQLKFGLKYAPLRTKLHLLKNFLSK